MKYSSQDPDDMEVGGVERPEVKVYTDAKQQDPSNANQHGTSCQKCCVSIQGCGWSK